MTPEKVLIVEDEENERVGLAELISGWGYHTETAHDGLEGLEKVELFAPGIVLTDLKMPRMDGMSLLSKLAERSESIAVIVVTAQGTIESAVQAMQIGAFNYIQKPIDFNRLKSILQNASELRQTRTELEVTRRQLRNKGQLGALVG
ncbi:MAG TPA: response regulator, partial [Terriglobales bacterium]|nr:response regulator [Terriglobales bacterium]